MELTIQKRDFLRGLARTHAVADRKSSMPILSNILVSAEGSEALRLSATDLYLGVTAMSPASIKKGGSIAVAARTLFDIVKALPDGEISWKVTDKHSVAIQCGRVKYRIPGMPGDDFPPLPAPGDATFVSIDASMLGELISLTQYSMSSDDTRPHLAGTLFEWDGKLVRMVTTDGHRLSKAERKLPEGAHNLQMLVPYKGVTELKRVIEDAKASRKKSDEGPLTVEITTAGGNAFFRRDDIMLSVKLAEEQFPPYDRVIPKKQTKKIVAARSGLIEALRRIGIVANDKSGGVQVHVEAGQIRIQSQNPDVGEGVEELDVDYAGDSISIGFNARYLLDALTALTHDEVCLELGGEFEPGVIRPVGDGADFVGVIMPMRI